MMLQLRSRHSVKGFTLLELVVVLAISGLIFAGLWGLLTSGSAQLQAQSASQQYRKVIDATRRLLSPGVAVTASIPANNFDPSTFSVNSPASLSLAVLTDSQVGLLSPNFSQGSGANYFDAFGHQIQVMVEKLDTSNQKWRFMVYSTPPSGVPSISDKVGAQIASLIGSEGGFVYTVDTEGCLTGTAAAQKSCGAFNSFGIALADMDVPTGAGRVATLSFTNDNSNSNAPWLMRLPAPSGTDFNTMSTSMDFLNGTFALTMRGSAINMGAAAADTSGGGALNINGGEFNMLSGTINMNAAGSTTGGGTINMAGGVITNIGAGGTLPGSGDVRGRNATFAFNNLTMTSTSSLDISTGLSVNVSTSAVGGTPALSINGIGRADEFQAGQFIYTSDMRLKENIRPIPNALDKVMQLRGMSYEWRSNHASDVGLVAQDVEKVFPELVSNSSGTKGIDYAKMVAPLIEAVRQLKQENDALRAKVNAMETRLPSP